MIHRETIALHGFGGAVVTFIAMLEFSRERLLELMQTEAFAPSFVQLAHTPI